jgi:hypothetical protein
VPEFPIIGVEGDVLELDEVLFCDGVEDCVEPLSPHAARSNTRRSKHPKRDQQVIRCSGREDDVIIDRNLLIHEVWSRSTSHNVTSDRYIQMHRNKQ